LKIIKKTITLSILPAVLAFTSGVSIADSLADRRSEIPIEKWDTYNVEKQKKMVLAHNKGGSSLHSNKHSGASENKSQSGTLGMEKDHHMMMEKKPPNAHMYKQSMFDE